MNSEKPVVRYVRNEDRKRISYDSLSSYDWVENFVKQRALEAELAELEADRKVFVEAGLARAGKLKSLEAFHKAYETARIAKIAKILGNWRGTSNPFYMAERTGKRVLVESLKGEQFIPPKFEMADFEKALALMPDQGGKTATLEASDKKLAAMDEKIEFLKAEILALYPKGRTNRWREGIEDRRQVLIDWWVRWQRQVDRPINPLCMDLKASKEAERTAFFKLGIGAYVDKNSPFIPCGLRRSEV